MRDIETIFRELKEAFEAQTEVRESAPGRVISRPVRTVKCGMMAEFPVCGWLEVSGVSRMSGTTTLSNVRGETWTQPSNRRVRTRKPQ